MTFGANFTDVPKDDYNDHPKFKFENVGDTLIGVVTGTFYEMKTKYGVTSKLDVVQNETGTIFSVWLSSKSLHRLFVDEPAENSLGRRPQKGDQIALRLAELIPTSKGNPMKRYQYELAAATAESNRIANAATQTDRDGEGHEVPF